MFMTAITPTQEYAKLSQEQKKALHELRKNRTTKGITNVSTISVEEVKTKTEEEEIETMTNNRNNPALRQKTPRRP
jgi:hypothetical protein